MPDRFNQFNLYSMRVNNEKIDKNASTLLTPKDIDIDIDMFLNKYENAENMDEKLAVVRNTFSMYDGKKFFEDKKTGNVIKVYINGTFVRLDFYSNVGHSKLGTIEQLSRETDN